MQRGGGGRDGFFGFGGPFPGFGSFVQPGSLMSSFFGGTNPFDDPFFTNPSGAMMGPSLFQQSVFGPHRDLSGAVNNAGGLLEQAPEPSRPRGFVQPGSLRSSFFGGTNPFDDPFFTNPLGAMMGPSLFQQSMFGPHRDLSGAVNNAGGFLEQAPEPSRPRGPIIKELSSDDEDDADVNKEEEKNKGNPRKHPRMSKEPYVEDPDEETQDDKRPKHEQFGRYVRASTSHPQPQAFMFQSSTVTYGGPNGACYTSSTTRRTGGNITVEESKEADTATGKATHRVSRGIGNKGHSFTRKLNYDGNVNTMQALHNLNEDELAGFEESWQRNAGQNLPGYDPRVNMLGSGTVRPDVRDENQMLALPAPDQSRASNFTRMKMHSQNGSSSGHSRRT